MIGNLGLLACLLLSSREVRCWQSKSKLIDRLNQKSIDNNDDERGNADKEEGGDEREGKGREGNGREGRKGEAGMVAEFWILVVGWPWWLYMHILACSCICYWRPLRLLA